jgi:hypothetical protein
MRIHPVAGGSIRESPPGGVEIQGHYIPEGVRIFSIYINAYVINIVIVLYCACKMGYSSLD